jgi:NAD(P)-dependent dehydrogenase (short-subunit alcohol dehydrogenase family)
MRLRDKVAVVTGGGSGMGEAIASLFADEGAAVAIADIDHDKAAAVASRIQLAGHKARAHRVDVADEDQVRHVVGAVLVEFERIDILVNCAGIMDYRPAVETTLEQWRRVIDIDLTGVFLCCREVGKAMIGRGTGKIVNIGSTVSLSGAPETATYTAAKHGVLGLTRALAVEWAKYGINVNCICPGGTLTPMSQGADVGPEYWAERTRRIPLGRLAQPDDQARAALFLASSDSDYVTGSALCVDGGVAALAPGTSDTAIRGGG